VEALTDQSSSSQPGPVPAWLENTHVRRRTSVQPAPLSFDAASSDSAPLGLIRSASGQILPNSSPNHTLDCEVSNLLFDSAIADYHGPDQAAISVVGACFGCCWPISDLIHTATCFNRFYTSRFVLGLLSRKKGKAMTLSVFFLKKMYSSFSRLSDINILLS
jgi:hypothetical protein